MEDYKSDKYRSMLNCISFYQQKESEDLDNVINIQIGMLSQYGIFVTKEQILEDVERMRQGQQVAYSNTNKNEIIKKDIEKPHPQGKIKSLVKAIRKIV